MKIRKIITLTIAVLLLGVAIFVIARQKGNDIPFSYNVSAKTDTYQEYLFDLGADRDLGFTHRALDLLRKEEKLLDENSDPVKDVSMEYVEVSAQDQSKGIFGRRKYGNDTYELRATGEVKSEIGESFAMFKNGSFLFEKAMEYGADGPVMDWRIVQGKPAFTYSPGFAAVAGGIPSLSGHSQIYYEGEFLTEKYRVWNPRYLFEYKGKFGFVATDENGDRIFFDGKFITPAFDIIHTHNCCSYMEILPTAYENGTLLFYGQRDTKNYQHEKNYIVEVKL